MIVLRARNVHEALPEAVRLLLAVGVERESRNGKVLVAREPVTTVYERPLERVLFWPERDANPFFHLYEALWMLGGRKDVASLTHYVKRVSRYSADEATFHGAYGARWRWDLDGGHDQLKLVIEYLKGNPHGRRAVLAMWETNKDLTIADEAKFPGSVDVPCNLVAHFQVSDDRLDMTVFCRSNDIVWGAYGANAVHFSVLQEYVAAHVGLPVGRYWQVSDNWHAYLDTLAPVKVLADRTWQPHRVVQWANPYEEAVAPYPMIRDPARWDSELKVFLDVGPRAMGYEESFFRRVAVPMVLAHEAHRRRDYDLALETASTVAATDWRRAVVEWLQRRRDNHERRRRDEEAVDNI